MELKSMTRVDVYPYKINSHMSMNKSSLQVRRYWLGPDPGEGDILPKAYYACMNDLPRHVKGCWLGAQLHNNSTPTPCHWTEDDGLYHRKI